MKNFIYLILWLVLMLMGCSNHIPTDWTPRQQNDQAVWADDSSEVAVIKLSFEEKRSNLLSSTTEQRHFKHQILVQNLDGSGQRAITQWRNYKNGQLFYMKQAGYLVVEALLESGARRFDKIALNGNEILIIETPDSDHQPCQDQTATESAKEPARVQHAVIPSPDGQQLVHIYSPECGQLTVEFLYANSLNVFDTQTMKIDEPMTATWHPGGYVIFANHKNDKAWKVTPLAPQLPVTPPNCLSPVTTSSDISLEGLQVYFEGEQLATKEMGRQRAFGCQ